MSPPSPPTRERCRGEGNRTARPIAPSPTAASTTTACGPTSAPAATLVAPRSTVNGWTTESASSSTPWLDPGRPGSTIVTPASMCASLIRRRSSRGRDRQLGARVDPQRRRARRGTTHGGGAMAGGDELLDRVGQVELALRVVRVQPAERLPERARQRRHRSRSSARGSHVARGVASRVLDDRLDRAVGAADDPAVRVAAGSTRR